VTAHELDAAPPREDPSRRGSPLHAVALPRGRLARSLTLGLLLSGCFFLALGPRLAGLDTYGTSDEGFWIQRTLRFGAALAQRQHRRTYRTGHPGVTVMWVGLLGVGPQRLEPFIPIRYSPFLVLQRRPGYLEVLSAARQAIVVATAALTVLIIVLAWKLVGAGPAAVGGLLLLFDPYLVGMLRVLHVDALLTPLMTVSALAGLIYWRQGRRPAYLALSAVAGGLALLTKAPAAYLPIYLGMVGLLAARPWRTGWRGLLPTVVWGLIAAGVYGALWPALWVDPIGRLQQVAAFALSVGGNPHRWPNYFMGQAMLGDPGPFYYPVALAYRLSPIVLFGLLALLLVRRRQGPFVPSLLLLAYVVPFIALMTLAPKKFDRYMLPVIPILVLLAGVGLWTLSRKLAIIPRAVALVVPIGMQITLLWQSYPYPIAFYNPLLGGAAGAERAIIVGWGEGLEQTAGYLDQLPGAERLAVSTNYHHVLRPLFRGATAPIREPTRLDYFVVYVNMAQRGLIPPAVEQAMSEGPPEFTAIVNEVEYAWVYRVSGIVQQRPEVPPDADEEQG